MKWTIKINWEKQYAEVVTSGNVNKDGSLDMVKDILKTLSQSKIKKILIDHSNIKSVSGEPLDVYNRPKQLEKIGVNHEIKVAEVIKREHEAFFYFLKILCGNKGYQFSFYFDFKSALDWLLEK